MDREYRWINPAEITPKEASDKLRTHLYQTALKLRALDRDVMYMEELYSVIGTAFDLYG